MKGFIKIGLLLSWICIVGGIIYGYKHYLDVQQSQLIDVNISDVHVENEA